MKLSTNIAKKFNPYVSHLVVLMLVQFYTFLGLAKIQKTLARLRHTKILELVFRYRIKLLSTDYE